MMKIGEKLVPYNNNFRLFLTTKIGNPHFPPEVCTTTTLVNFAIKEEGKKFYLIAVISGTLTNDIYVMYYEIIVIFVQYILCCRVIHNVFLILLLF